MLSMVNVGLLTYKNEQFGVKTSFEQFLKRNYSGNMKAFLQERKELALVQRKQILIAGRVKVPKIYCLKELRIQESMHNRQKVIPLALKNGVNF